ncbi:MAG: 4-hydroxy-3-methylbut-2-enyl diphosphate reductase [Clostridia bacterium]|nr:4-hydroxy-3-methylbut-2-enyl diphosphate reductase [Clostridia bacterium]
MSGRMQITVAENAGFCFGVKRATDALKKALLEKGPSDEIYTLGQLIHNEVYLAELEKKGVRAITEQEMESVADRAREGRRVTLFLRAHGVPMETLERLDRIRAANPRFDYVDCTCPFVQKIRKIAHDCDEKKNILILFGKPEHPEIRGIVSCTRAKTLVFEDAQKLMDYFQSGVLDKTDKNNFVFAVQTTFNLSQWHKITNFLDGLFTKSQINDTICNVTEVRQTEAKTMSAQNDLMIVIGGKDSSNTARLYEICRENCAQTIRIGQACELSDYRFQSYTKKVGIVAGASTPDDYIEEVYQTMSEISNNENFDELLESESSCKIIKTGEIVRGTVVYVSDSEIQLDLSASVTGFIKAEQITDDSSVKLTEMFKPGDQIDAKVIRVSDVDGIAELSKKAVDSNKSWNALTEAKETKAVLTGKVIEAVKGGLIVLVNSNRIFVPESLSGVPKNGSLSELVGQTKELRIIEVKENGKFKRAVGSIRAVAREKAREERREREDAFWGGLEVGQVRTGKVKSMTDYGVFVDIGGFDGLVHITDLTWKRIRVPSDIVSVGDELTVYIKSFDREKKRISLGCKTEENKPWNIFTSQYSVGSVASVTIVNMMDFGAFAQIIDGVDGLIHISQIADHRIEKPSDVLEIGQNVDAKIIDIDYDKKKVSLSIRALIEEARAAEAEEAEEASEQAEEAPAQEENA